MKRIINTVFIALVFLGFVSCKQQIPYTKKVETTLDLSDAQMREIQFHLVGDIVLTRGSSEGNTELEDGDIHINESQNMDKIIIRSGTQGVFVKKIDGQKIAVSFEKSDDFYLVFGATSIKGLYTLQAEKWSKTGKGKQTYGGESFVSSKESSKAYITVKVKKSKNYNSSQRVAGGRKI